MRSLIGCALVLGMLSCSACASKPAAPDAATVAAPTAGVMAMGVSTPAPAAVGGRMSTGAGGSSPSNTRAGAAGVASDAGPDAAMRIVPAAMTKDAEMPLTRGADAALVASDAASDPPPALPFDGEGDPWLDPVPKASCGASDKPETGIQGSGGDFSCNLIVHGKIEVPSSVSHAFYGSCAYVNGPAETTVLDLSDSAKPRIATTLTTLGMQNNWESMKVHDARGLLVGYQAGGPVLDVYDVAADCARPVRKASFNIEGGTGHAGQFSPDGTIYYTSNWDSTNAAIDLTDPTKPKLITKDFGGAFAHDPFIGKQGTRGYFPAGNTPGGLGSGSLVIVDLTDVQARAAGAKGRPIKAWNWDDGSVSQYAIALNYGDRTVVVVSDELGSGNCDNPAKPPYGYAHLFDVTDELNPVLTARVMTEGTGPCKDGKLIGDGFFGVGTHYCTVDRLDSPRLLACGFFAGGVRVFDIRNPWRPKEIAYFSTSGGGVGSMPRIRVPEQELWVPNQNGTYYVLKFTNAVLDVVVNQ